MSQRSRVPTAPHVVTLTGDIDLAAADSVRDTLLKTLRETRADRVEIDLAAVPFLDSSGIRVLIQAKKDADERGIGFTLTNAADPVTRVLATLGLEQYLGLNPL